jgi:prenyltransferase beta subunit
MLRAARRASETLGEAASLVRAFVASQRDPDGGYRNRDGKPDLYYTVFGLTAAWALDPATVHSPDRLPTAFLPPPADLSLVNLASLARCLALTQHSDLGLQRALRERLDAFRAADGAFAAKCGAARGTIYGTFLALGVAEDLVFATAPSTEAQLSDLGRLADAIFALQLPDGSFANDHSIGVSTIPTTAAAVAILDRVGVPLPQAGRTAEWLVHQAITTDLATGWPAAPGAPMPDLLSTAVALDALVRLKVALPQKMLAGIEDFVDSLWSSDGTHAGFCGTWTDDVLDVEYTCYGLVVLGLLRNLDATSIPHAVERAP